MSIGYCKNAAFLKKQQALHQHLQDHYSNKYSKIEADVLDETIIWVASGDDLRSLLLELKSDSETKLDYLSSLTAYDNQDGEDGSKRFVVVYNFLSTEFFIRLRIKLAVDDGESAPTICDLWPAANWLEREVWDMFGIKFANHPNLRRLMMDERFTGHPLRKEYPIKQREPFADNIPFNLGAQPMPSSEG